MALALPGLLASCLLALAGPTWLPVSKRPLSDPRTALPDAQLVGLWRSVGESKETEHVHIGRSSVKDAPPGLMQAMGVASDNADGRLRFSLNGYFFTTALGGTDYATLVPRESVESKLPSFLTSETYSFVKYRVRSDLLEVWPPDEAALAAAVASGELRGQLKVQEGRARRLVVDEEAAGLARFFANGGEAKVFPESRRLVYRRVP